MNASVCTICCHDKRAEIELLLAGCARKDNQSSVDSVGTLRRPSIVRIAKRFGVGRMALQRHWRRHVPQDRQTALIAGPGVDLAAAAVFAAEAGVGLYDAVEQSAMRFYARSLLALQAGRETPASTLYARFLDAVRLLAQLKGDLQRGGAVVTNNIAILQSPLMADLQRLLVERLEPFPDARASVLEGLEELSRRSLPAPAPVQTVEAAHG
ncbi:MAG: hypothetical protein ACYCUE_04910 [Steroidobacteraceae bacterium]